MSKTDKPRLTEYLGHILEAIRRIHDYIDDMDEAAFQGDPKTQDAVVRNFEIIGEACNNISKYHAEFAAQNAHIPWGFAYEMRNALAHGYFKVDLDIVWNTIQQDLPILDQQIKRIVKPS
jgi:uncharacterized protein with HEPN domain